MFYELKYLKYKNKYLKYRNQLGGMPKSDDPKTKILKKLLKKITTEAMIYKSAVDIDDDIDYDIEYDSKKEATVICGKLGDKTIEELELLYDLFNDKVRHLVRRNEKMDKINCEIEEDLQKYKGIDEKLDFILDKLYDKYETDMILYEDEIEKPEREKQKREWEIRNREWEIRNREGKRENECEREILKHEKEIQAKRDCEWEQKIEKIERDREITLEIYKKNEKDNEIITITAGEVRESIFIFKGSNIKLLNKCIEKIKSCLNGIGKNEIIRHRFAINFAWAIPNRDAIESIYIACGRNKILEICAGNGLWAALLRLRGCKIIATDTFSSHGVIEENNFMQVEKLSAEESVKKYKFPVLMICMPPFDDEFANDALIAFKGNILIYIGNETRRKSTATDSFYDSLEKGWNIKIQRSEKMNDMNCFLFIYERK